ncbi:hypothetical protein [Flavobacterium sp.]|uniref:hypothetical protein n=1 Tax=Flavobacterium sp. TaxID=239 RepID=UPI0031E3DA6B
MRRKINNAVRFMVILLVSFTFAKCQKDDNDVGQTDARILSSAKEWFKAYELKGDNFALLQNLNYNWNDAEIRNSKDGTKTIIVPVNEAKKDATELWEQKLYIYQLSENNYEALLFEIFPNGTSRSPEDLSIDSATFSGYIAAWDLKKGFVKTASFENGRLIENGTVKLVLKNANTTGKAPSGVACPAGIECDVDGGGTTDTGIQLKEVVVYNNYQNTSSGGYIIYNGTGSGYSNYTDTGSYTNHGTGTGSGSESGENQSSNTSTPCEQMKVLINSADPNNMIAGINWLKSIVNGTVNNKEFGIEIRMTMNADQTFTYQYNQFSSPNEFSVALTTDYYHIGGAHSHPENGYAMFSFADVRFLSNAYNEASPLRKNDVIFMVVAKDKAGITNTYAIKVDNIGVLNDKVNQVWNNPKFIGKTDDEKIKIIHKDQGYKYRDSKGALEESFLQQFGSFGISLYKADSSMSKWNKLTLNTTTNKTIQTPCI